MFLLLALTGLASASPAAPRLELTVDTGVAPGQSVRPGDVLTLTVSLAYSGGSGPVTTRLTGTLPAGLTLAGRPTIREMPAQSVNPLTVKRRGRTVGWQGQLRNGGQLTLDVPVRVDNCWNGFRNRTISAAALRPDGALEQAQATVKVHCPLATLDDIQVTQRIVGGEAPAWAPYMPVLVPGQALTLRTTFRNDAPVPVLLGVTRARVDTSTAATADAATRRIRYLTLQPGETRSVDHALRVGRGFDNEQLMDGDAALESSLVYCLLTGGERVCASPPGQIQTSRQAAGCGSAEGIRPDIPCPPDPGGDIPEPSTQVTMTIPVRPNDLGDAPDSTNHAGLTMNAYPGVPAHFPTVFARLPGDPPGPLHRHARPVHLGLGVSLEAEADAGPDADPTNNLLPGQGVGNWDRFDDGLSLSSVTLGHCQPARMQVQVGLLNNQVKQALLSRNIQKLYLNVWIDGNRDGDWNDTGPCSQQPGDLALEHIVIDHPVSVGQLVQGNNPVSVVSNVKALWPNNLTDQSAWLRITLSEVKSPKLTGRAYGDGRGPAKGYRLGETEDYLWQPPGTADVVVAQSSMWVNRPDFGNGTSLDTERFAQFRITYGNEGNARAQDVKITQKLTGFGGQPQLVHVSAPGLPDSAVRPGDGEITFDLGDLAPGAGGSILVGWRPQAGARSLSAGSRYTATVTVSSQNDANPGNDSATTGIEETAFVQMGFRTGDAFPLLRQGSTCRGAVELVGQATPGAQVHLRVDGVTLPDVVSANEQGRWRHSLGGLADGLHVVRAWVLPEVGDEVLVRVDSSLPIDPASFTITDAAGHVFPPDTLGRSWRNLRLVGSGPFELGVTGCIDLSQVVSKYIGETEKNIVLTDPDGDGRYTGTLDLGGRVRAGGAASLSLTVQTSDGEVTFDMDATFQAEGQVLDAATGQPLANATVLLISEEGAANSAALDSGYGQANPQTTGADGSFFFAPPPGVYRLLVVKDGYQAYRTATVQVDDSPVAPTLRLTPEVTGEPEVTVVVGEDGFAPNVLTIPPGTVVAWVNGDLAEHTSTGDSANQNGGGWDSGVLLAGESFRWVFDQEETFTYGDGENPLNQGTVTVDPSAPPVGTRFVYLPAVAR